MGQQFDKWIDRFERELKYNGVDLNAKADLAQMAFLIYAGPDVEEIHETLVDPPKPEGMDDNRWTSYAKSKARLTNFFTPKKCNDFQIHQLISLKMSIEDTVETFAMKLRVAADKCDFSNWSKEKMIKALLISNMRDEELRLKLLQKERTLDAILNIARTKADAVERLSLIHI